MRVTPMQGMAGLVALTLVVGGGNLWSGYDQARSQARSQARAVLAVEHREQVSQQHAGVILGEKLCTTFGRLAALKPPAGNPAVNPSRAFDQSLHATLDELGTDLGCR
jgi:hypothetical protein